MVVASMLTRKNQRRKKRSAMYICMRPRSREWGKTVLNLSSWLMCLVVWQVQITFCSGFYRFGVHEFNFFLFAVRCFEMYIDVCICNHSVERMVDGFNGPYNEQDVRLSFVVDEFDVMVQWSLHRWIFFKEITEQADAYLWLLSCAITKQKVPGTTLYWNFYSLNFIPQ